MGFKELASLDADVTTPIGGVNKKTGKKNPSSVEGYYLGTREVESKKSKNGLSKIHFLQTDKGNVGVWGKTDMDRKLDGVTPGCMIRITHTGMQPTPNGEMYKYKVEVDEDNTIQVSSNRISSLGGSEDSSDYDSESLESYEDTEDQGYEEEDNAAQLAAAAKSSAARSAKVAALLKGKKA